MQRRIASLSTQYRSRIRYGISLSKAVLLMRGYHDAFRYKRPCSRASAYRVRRLVSRMQRNRHHCGVDCRVSICLLALSRLGVSMKSGGRARRWYSSILRIHRLTKSRRPLPCSRRNFGCDSRSEPKFIGLAEPLRACAVIPRRHACANAMTVTWPL